MIFTIFLILIISLFCVLFLFKEKLKIKNIFKLTIYLFIIFFSTSSIYFFKSNYWLGDSIYEKITNNINIKEINKVDPATIIRIVSFLENDLKNNPTKLDTIKKLAQIKYLLGDFKSSVKLFNSGSTIDENDIELVIGEANARLMLEGNKISKYTVSLFNKIIEIKPNNLIALVVLADFNYNENKLDLASFYYKKLLGLLDKNSLEYKKTYEKYKSINQKNAN